METFSENLETFEMEWINVGEKKTQVSHTPIIVTRPKICVDKAIGNDFRSPVFSGFESTQNDEKLLVDLTGVSKNVFSLLLHCLPSKIHLVDTQLSWENKLLLFLMKLKGNLTYRALGSLFNIASSTASRIFTTILNLLYTATESWIFWPSRLAIKSTMPSSFKKHYPNCRVIIDCTEIKCEKPPGVDKQVKMYSNYKGTWTVKFLIGITPSGFTSFISKGYGGRASDPYITNDCGFLHFGHCNLSCLAV